MREDTERAELPLHRLTALSRRIKEHRIAQWTVGYVAVAYGIQHAVTLTSEAYEWPNIVARLSMTLLTLGLPLAMTLAWYHGERASRGVGRGEMAIVSVMLVGISLAFYLFVRPAVDIGVRAPTVQEASVTAARQASLDPHGAISVAVMPFANVSGDASQDYFSDGMTDEISGALAKIPDLRVVARSSVFEFKGKDRNARDLGKALGATHLIEGSVRRAGDQLRISVELVKADDGVTLWSSAYDRQLKDVFAVQEDVARAIAASFHMTLGLKPGENLVQNRGIEPNDYQEYLRIRARVNAAPLIVTRQAVIPQLENLVARNPGFAPALAYLADMRVRNMLVPGRRLFLRPVAEIRAEAQEIDRKAEAEAHDALRLDPRQPTAYMVLGIVEENRARWAAAEDSLKQALLLDANDPDILRAYGLLLGRVGRLREWLGVARLAQSLEPLMPQYQQNLAAALLANGAVPEGAAMLEGKRIRQNGDLELLALAYAVRGRFDSAADQILRIDRNAFGDGGKSIDDAARMLREIQKSGSATKPLPRLPSGLEFVYAYTGAPELAMDLLERAAPAELLSIGQSQFFSPAYAQARKTERFQKFARAIGLVDYWKARGWPDLCHPTTGDDFECN